MIFHKWNRLKVALKARKSQNFSLDGTIGRSERVLFRHITVLYARIWPRTDNPWKGKNCGNKILFRTKSAAGEGLIPEDYCRLSLLHQQTTVVAWVIWLEAGNFSSPTVFWWKLIICVTLKNGLLTWSAPLRCRSAKKVLYKTEADFSNSLLETKL